MIGTPRAAMSCVVMALLLAGCASKPQAPTPQFIAPLPMPDDPPPHPWAQPLSEFESRQRQAGDAAARQGQWAQALWAWDVLDALHPSDPALATRRAQAQAAAQAAAAEHLQRARQAQQRGDADVAMRQYLEVLSLTPGQTEAADGLRAIERDRIKRLYLGPQARRQGAETAPPTARTPATGLPSSERNEIEHASLLAAQGEIDGAIAVLKPVAGARRGDPAARRLLADLYFRQAEGLAGTNRAAAIRALELSVQADPNHPKASERLMQLRAAVKSAVPPPQLAPPPAP